MSTWIGYKEWEGVCAALAAGEQHILLRKGGIHEGRAGFSFKHERFCLFPTRFHAQGEQLRREFQVSGREWEPGDVVPIELVAEAAWAKTLSDWSVVERLAEYHQWTEELVRERFEWGEGTSIHCALVRVWKTDQPWELTYEKKYGGCRTWVNLPDPPAGWEESLVPVVGNEAFGEVEERLHKTISK